MTNPLRKRWSELDDNMRASGINLSWTGCNDFAWNIGGFMAGAQGAIIEVHPDPDHALSDGAQSLDIPTFAKLAAQIRAYAAVEA